MFVHDVVAEDPLGQRKFRIPFRGSHNLRAQPLSNLPDNIKFPDGATSLIADFSKTETNRIPVYLINAADRSFPMETVAMEIPIVLEAHLGNGHWERAESHNAYGFTSIRKIEYVSSQTFKVKKARHWDEGEPATLRYALYQDGKAAVFSPAFEGLLPVGEIEKARHDFLAAALVPKPLRIRYIPEDTSFEEISRDWPAKLSLLRSFGPCYLDLAEAQKWIAFVHESSVSSEAERKVAVGLQMELLQKWPFQYDLSKLHENCHSILKNNTPTNQNLRPICWNVMQGAEADSHAAELAEIAWETIQTDSPIDELKAATDFLCIDHIARKLSPVLKVKNRTALLQQNNPYLRITTANHILSNKGDHTTILNHYLEDQPDASAYELVHILHFDRLYNPFAKPNWKLWEIALDKDPAYTIPRLSLMFESDNEPTKLRKFSKASVLPDSIKQRLVKFCADTSDVQKRQAIQRLLDDVHGKRNRSINQLLF